MLTLVLGGEKSGKSDHALGLLAQVPGPRLFMATGKALDAGFRRQINRHRRERPADLPMMEVAEDLAGTLEAARPAHGAILVDSLDFWLFHCGPRAAEQTERLLTLLDGWPQESGCRLILVSAEIGLGPIAASRETRSFIRALGELNRALAARAGQACLLVAGLPVRLK